MKKSKLYYSGAATAFLISLGWSFLVFWNYAFLKNMPFGRFPFTAFVFIFVAIFLVNRANKLNNIEHNRPAAYIPSQSKAWKLVNYSGIGLIVIGALVIVAKMLLSK